MSDRDSDVGSVSRDLVTKSDSLTSEGGTSDSAPRLIPSNAFGDLSRISNVNTSDQSISTGIGSPFTSFDSNIESDLMSSMSSCGGGQLSLTGLPAPSTPTTNTTMTPPPATKFPHGGGWGGEAGSGDEQTADRSQTRSPVNFREGRRASDGLLTQGVIAFRQRLRDSMRTPGMTELRQEMETLQTRYRTNMTRTELQQLQRQHSAYQERVSLRQWSLDEPPAPSATKLQVKRKSLPTSTVRGTDMLAPHQLLAMKHSLQIERRLESPQEGPSPAAPTAPAPAAPDDTMATFGLQACEFGGPGPGGSGPLSGKQTLQQQLMQHRLQQKRQGLQKSGPPPGGPPQPPTNPPQQLQQQFQQMNIDGPAPPPGSLPIQGSLPLQGAGTSTAGPAPTTALTAPLLPLDGMQQRGVAGSVAGGVVAGPLFPGDLPAVPQPLFPQPHSKLGLMRRPAVVRQTSYKLAQQAPVIPPPTYTDQDPAVSWTPAAFDQTALATMLEEVVPEVEEGEGGGGGDTMEVS